MPGGCLLIGVPVAVPARATARHRDRPIRSVTASVCKALTCRWHDSVREQVPAVLRGNHPAAPAGSTVRIGPRSPRLSSRSRAITWSAWPAVRRSEPLQIPRTLLLHLASYPSGALVHVRQGSIKTVSLGVRQRSSQKCRIAPKKTPRNTGQKEGGPAWGAHGGVGRRPPCEWPPAAPPPIGTPRFCRRSSRAARR